MMTNKGIVPHSIAIDGIVDGFIRIGDLGQAISFAQHAFNQVHYYFYIKIGICGKKTICRYEELMPSSGVRIHGVPIYGVFKLVRHFS